jgi:hypothetical protein
LEIEDMNAFHFTSAVVLASGVAGFSAQATADDFDISMNTTSDRWMYPFNISPGIRPGGSVFGYVPYPVPAEQNFDNRDGQVIIAFDTTDLIETNAGVSNYRIDSLVVEITLSGQLSSPVDETTDDWKTYLPNSSKDWVSDSDAGRPIELFAAGFRFGYTRDTWTDDAPFSVTGPIGTLNRTVFSAEIMTDGSLDDVSSSFAAEFTPNPLAVATFPGYSPGDTAPEGAIARFEIDLTAPENAGWVAESLDAGRIIFAVTSLVTAAQGDATLTQFYLKENPLVTAGARDSASMAVVGAIEEGCPLTADFTGDCKVNGADLGLLLAAWGTDDPIYDLSGNSIVGGEDIGLLLAQFTSG